MPGNPGDEVFGPVVLPEQAPELPTRQPHDTAERIEGIQRRLAVETKRYQAGVAKRQFMGRGRARG